MVMSVMASELRATHKIALSSADSNNPLPDLTSATAITVTILLNGTAISGSPFTASAVDSSHITYMPGSLAAGAYRAYASATWPDGGVSNSTVWEIDAQPLQ